VTGVVKGVANVCVLRRFTSLLCTCCLIQRIYECIDSDMHVTHSLKRLFVQQEAARSRSGASLFMFSSVVSG
jgi:hypothetical protein